MLTDLRFARHRRRDPHCTCPDCLAWHFEPDNRVARRARARKARFGLLAVVLLTLAFLLLARLGGPDTDYDPCAYRADDCHDLSIDHGPTER